jgi:serine/threonine protein kinase
LEYVSAKEISFNLSVFYFREVKHENIVAYYGCTLQQSGQTRRNVHWIMIMEYCDDTLKNKFINSEYDNPAKVGNIYSVQVGQMEELARYAMQICRGLEYLHTKKLVHRDMKLENILVRLSLAL